MHPLALRVFNEQVQTLYQQLAYSAWTHLVSNACKFTTDGRIRFEVNTPAPGLVCFSVSDTGIGIPASDLDKIVAEFHQVEETRTVRTGTSLGLAIVYSSSA